MYMEKRNTGKERRDEDLHGKQITLLAERAGGRKSGGTYREGKK